MALVASVVPLQAQNNGPYVTSLYIAVLHRLR